MFGSTKPSFGTTSATGGFGAFGSPTNASPFGSSFGKPATTGFNTNAPVFGAGAPSTSLFGNSSQPASGLFGAPSATSAFGAPSTTQSFGFGQPSSSTSLFGANTAGSTVGTSSTLFGSATTSAFGQPNKSSTFGFGTTQPTSGLFGQTTSTQAPASTGLFGQTAAPSTGTGLFGNTGFASGTTGTVIKFNPVTGTDMMVKSGQSTSINTKHHCITCMKEYEGKSLEELRLEDYMANRKGPQAGGLGTSSPFSITSSQTGLFGQQSTTTPQTGGIFGQQENKPLFGSTTPSLAFGSTTPAFGTAAQPGTSTLFGSKPATAFGAQPAATTTSAFSFNTSTFGSNTQAKPFGSTTPQTGLFGQPATSTFGTPSTGFSGFGTPSTQSSSLFGAKTTGSPFSLPTSTTAGFAGFGQTATTTTATPSLFGAKPAGTGFGTSTAFGTPATSTGFGGFGQTTSTSSLFNSSFNKPTTSTFGFGSTTTGNTLGGGTSTLFGGSNTAAKPGGLFGSTPTSGTSLFGGTNTFGSSNALTNTGLGNTTLGAQPSSNTTIPIHQQFILMSQSFGDSPLFKNLSPASGKVEELLRPTNPAAQKAALDNAKYKLSTSGREAKVKIKPLSWAANPKKTLFDGLEEFDPTVEAFCLKPNPKRLILKSKSENSSVENLSKSMANSTSFKIYNGEEIQASTTPPALQGILQKDKKSKEERRVSWLNTPALDNEKNKDATEQKDNFIDNTMAEFAANSTPISAHKALKAFELSQTYSVISGPLQRRNKPKSSFNESEKENLSDGSDLSTENQNEDNVAHFPSGIILTRVGYYTIPSLDKLADFMTEDNQCIVPNFTIGREGYGNVYFNDSFDVANLNLDEIVHFRHKEVIIYPDDDNKPPVGQGLNRRAQVTLDRVWPHDKVKHEPITDPEILHQIDYEEKLRRVCSKHDTRFLEYRPQTGSWVFKVDHFSKYGLSDSEDEDDVQAVKKPVKSPVIKAISEHIVNKVQKTKTIENGSKTLNKSFEDISKGLGGTVTNGNASYEHMNGHSHRHENYEDDSIKYNGIYPEIEDELHGSWGKYNGTVMVNGNVQSPTEHIAKESGINNHALQLMKASFFIYDEADDDLSTLTNGLEMYDDSISDQIVPKAQISKSQLSNDKSFVHKIQAPEIIHMEQTQKLVEETDLDFRSARHPEPIIVKPEIVALRNNQLFLPYNKSLISRGDCAHLNDASIFHGKQFKIGWGSENYLLTLTTKESCENLEEDNIWEHLQYYLEGRKKDDYSSVLVQGIKIGKGDEQFKELILQHLEVQLNHTEIEDNEKCPKAITKSGVLEEHFKVSKQLHENFGHEEFDKYHYNAQVWDLVKALWGYMKTLDGIESSSHLSVMCRRKAFSEWLERWSAIETVSKAPEKKDQSSESHLSTILNLLSQHKIPEAIEIAHENEDYYLSMLLSQISSGPMVREMMKKQLASWKNVNGDLFINPKRLRVFLLVAGVTLFESSHGLINVCDGLDWKKALAIHLWYICMPTASITDCLELYENAFNPEKSNSEFKPYACPPNPGFDYYFNAGEEQKTLKDLCFHLLKLYCSHSHSLESLLNPATHTSDALDYRLSWFLQQTLNSIGYGHHSEFSKCMIHTSFAAQLESNGLWHWAIFVLMHLESDERRAFAVREMLNRHVILSTEEQYVKREKFVLDELGIPLQWLTSAKALLAGNLQQYRVQAENLIQGKLWDEAHSVIMTHFAPLDFINGEVQSLKPLLSALNEGSSSISRWSIQGQVLFDFMELEKKIQNILSNKNENLSYHLQTLQLQLSSLCSRMNLFPCPTPTHTLCRCEMSKRLIGIIRGLIMQTNKDDSKPFLKVINQLPMPEDYIRNQLRTPFVQA